MIDVSKRELGLINDLLEELQHGADLAVVSGSGGHDLSDIENQLIVDILEEYVEGEE